MGNGMLFLPVKANIRKKIGKQSGDWVHVVLYHDHDPLAIPEELSVCLSDNPLANQNFMNCTVAEQKAFIDWIYSAKTIETKVERIVKTLERLEENKTFGIRRTPSR
jgi:uncharacterized protein YdeI (YjbR/CyaY-like superfamily)